MRSLSISSVVLFPPFVARFLYGQESVNYASISGRVTDPSSALVEGAQITARQADTNLTSTAVTDNEGRFRFPYLRVGQYEIKVHKEGFAQWTRTLTVSVGAAFELPVSLAVASTESNVIVTEEAAVLEAARSQIAGTVAPSEVRALPLQISPRSIRAITPTQGSNHGEEHQMAGFTWPRGLTELMHHKGEKHDKGNRFNGATVAAANQIPGRPTQSWENLAAGTS